MKTANKPLFNSNWKPVSVLKVWGLPILVTLSLTVGACGDKGHNTRGRTDMPPSLGEYADPDMVTLADGQSVMLPDPAADPVCQKYESEKSINAEKKKSEKYQTTYKSIIEACHKPWTKRYLGRLKNLGGSAAATFLLKFSASEEEERKRRLMDAVKEMELRNGGPLSKETLDKMGYNKLGWYEKIPALNLNERIHNWGMTKTTNEMLHFEGLDDALEECFPNSPVMKTWFVHSLISDDAKANADGVILGGAALVYGGWLLKGAGKLFSFAPRIARAIGITEKATRYVKYSAISLAVGGSLYSWYRTQQTEIRQTQNGENILRELNANITQLGEQLSRYKNECVVDINEAMIYKDNQKLFYFYLDLAKMKCDYYLQSATASIAEVIERPVYRCDKQRPQVLKSIIKDLDNYTSEYQLILERKTSI